MNPLTRIYIAEQDCESLVNTMLWLEQYPDLEVYGGTLSTGDLPDQLMDLQPDVVMLSVPSPNAQATLAAKTIRSVSPISALMLVTKSDTGAEAADCDAHAGPRTALKELPDLIKKAINRHRVSSIAATALPMALAG